MKLKDKVVVVTGGASGIGEAMCHKFHEQGAKSIVVVDVNEEGINRVAGEIGGLAIKADVSNEADIQNVVKETTEKCGPIDLFCSNAGIGIGDRGHAASATNEEWQRIWEINVMAHIYAARTVLPQMIERGEGYLLNTASAAGLLSQIGSAPYSVTKHAALGFAESLAITHGDDGIKVSVLCPQAVKTGMTRDGGGVAAVDGMMEADEAADIVVKGLDEESFLILTHPEVEKYMQRKTSDYSRWINGMRRLRKKVIQGSFQQK